MGTWVALSALGEPFVVRLDGVSDEDARAFVDSWEWCGAHFVDAAPEGAWIIHGVVTDFPEDAGDEGLAPKTHRALGTTYRMLADNLSGLITRLAIDERRGDLLMFHAGGVADPATGNVIAFIGPSGRGKTTASIALGSVFEYVTDETLGVRDDLGVLAYGKPLSVKQPAPIMWKDQVSPTSLGLRRPGGEPLRLVGVVMLDRQPGFPSGRKPSIRSVGVAESVEELVPQISYLPERPRPLQRLVEVLAACGGLRAVTYREAATLPEVFGEMFAAAAAAGGARSSGAGTGGVAVSAGSSSEVIVGAGQTAPGALQASYIDAIRDGDELVVLSGTTVRVLSGIAPTIMEATREPRKLSDVVAAVVDVYGDPGEGDAEKLVAVAVEELKSIGLLRVVG